MMRPFATAFAISITVAFSGASMAQPFESPEALLEAFYAPYFTGEFPDDDATFRSAALNALYQADAQATPPGELGALDFDPYIDGQDFELSNLEIGDVTISGDAATVEVTFDNFAQSTALTYDLVLEEGGWKIDDVVSDDPEFPYRLTDIFAGARAEQGPSGESEMTEEALDTAD